jgi:hypothetical protein
LVADPIAVAVVASRTKATVAEVAEPVPVGVRLIGVRHVGAVVGLVADRVAVGVGLSRTDAAVADIAKSVSVAVRLIGVGHEGAVVGLVAHPVVIGVGASRTGARVAHVAVPVRVAVRLSGVRDVGAVVAGVADAAGKTIAVRVAPSRRGVADAVGGAKIAIRADGRGVTGKTVVQALGHGVVEVATVTRTVPRATPPPKAVTSTRNLLQVAGSKRPASARR